jgi:hypothetical protein
MKLVSMLFLFFSISLFGCRPMELDGKVTNQKSEPIPNATVVNKRTGDSARSDNRGKVHLSNLHYDDTLIVRAEGYKIYEEEYEWRRGKQTFVLDSQ